MKPLILLTHVDERLLRSLVLRRRPAADAAMRAVTKLGDVLVVAPLTFALALGVIADLQSAGAVAFWTGASSHLLVQLMKRRIRRRRPTLPVGLGFLIEPEDRFSFPSGHAAAGLSLALPLALALRTHRRRGPRVLRAPRVRHRAHQRLRADRRPRAAGVVPCW